MNWRVEVKPWTGVLLICLALALAGCSENQPDPKEPQTAETKPPLPDDLFNIAPPHQFKVRLRDINENEFTGTLTGPEGFLDYEGTPIEAYRLEFRKGDTLRGGIDYFLDGQFREIAQLRTCNQFPCTENYNLWWYNRGVPAPMALGLHHVAAGHDKFEVAWRNIVADASLEIFRSDRLDSKDQIIVNVTWPPFYGPQTKETKTFNSHQMFSPGADYEIMEYDLRDPLPEIALANIARTPTDNRKVSTGIFPGSDQPWTQGYPSPDDFVAELFQELQANNETPTCITHMLLYPPQSSQIAPEIFVSKSQRADVGVLHADGRRSQWSITFVEDAINQVSMQFIESDARWPDADPEFCKVLQNTAVVDIPWRNYFDEVREVVTSSQADDRFVFETFAKQAVDTPGNWLPSPRFAAWFVPDYVNSTTLTYQPHQVQISLLDGCFLSLKLPRDEIEARQNLSTCQPT